MVTVTIMVIVMIMVWFKINIIKLKKHVTFLLITIHVKVKGLWLDNYDVNLEPQYLKYF